MKGVVGRASTIRYFVSAPRTQMAKVSRLCCVSSRFLYLFGSPPQVITPLMYAFLNFEKWAWIDPGKCEEFLVIQNERLTDPIMDNCQGKTGPPETRGNSEFRACGP
jgi:hypothetical protein